MRSETTEKQIARLYAFRDTIPADRPLAIENCDRAIDELLAQDDPSADAASLAAEVAQWADDTAEHDAWYDRHAEIAEAKSLWKYGETL